MARSKLPEKILIIKDCTFILPDDFNGTVEDAFEEFLKYREKHLKDAKFVDSQHFFSSFNLLLHGHKQRVCGHYSLYQLKDGKYEAVLEETDTDDVPPIK